MKTIITSLALLLGTVLNVAAQNKQTIKAFYEGFEEGTYTFIDAYGEPFYFDKIEKDVLTKYPLDKGKFIDSAFEIVFEIIENEEEDETLVIISLKPTELEVIEEELEEE